MKEKELFNYISKISSNLSEEEALSLLFLLKAWKILSLKSIYNNKLKFDTFSNQNKELEELKFIFEDLAKEHKIFKYYLNLNNILSRINSIILDECFYIIKNNELNININDAFSNNKLKSDFYVPNQIAELGIKLLGNHNHEIYIPFTNGFACVYKTDKKIYIEYPTLQSEFIAELINIIDNRKINFSLTNTLLEPTYVASYNPYILRKFESSFSCPPFGLKKKLDISNDKFNRFKIYKGSNLDIAHFEHILSQTKNKAAILMPVGFTYRIGLEKKLRKYLIEENILETIIQLAPNLHSATSIETTFFIINKEKKSDKIFFMNLKNEQFLKKEGRRVILNDINKILDIYINKKELESISTYISKDTVERNNYSLAIDKYIISKNLIKVHKKLSAYKAIKLENIAEIRKSQLLKNEGIGREIYELSPSDFTEAGFTVKGGKSKLIGSQESKYQTYKLKLYDVLLSTKGTIGKVAIIGKITNSILASQAIQVIRVKDKNKAIELYMFFKSNIGQSILNQLVVGVAMPQITTNELKKLKIPGLSNKEIEQLILNFHKEIELYNQINTIKFEIKKIHNNFLKKNMADMHG